MPVYAGTKCDVQLIKLHVKEPGVYVDVEITGKIDRPFLARNSVFR